MAKKSAKGPEATSPEVGVSAGADCCKGMNLFASDLNEEAELGIDVADALPANLVANKGIDDFNLLLAEKNSWSEENKVSGISGGYGKQCCGWIEASEDIGNQGSKAKKPNNSGEKIGGAWSQSDAFHDASFTHPTGMSKEKC
jgi:hypothetical protein